MSSTPSRTPPASADAVVVGAGHHGLVAACVLADAGWDVCVLEAADDVGGAVRSTRWPTADWTNDLFSAFYPLSTVSPALAPLDLEHHGLRWSHAPVVLAHPFDAERDRAAVLHRDVDDTAAALSADHPADGEAWQQLCAQWRRVRQPVLSSVFSAMPPLRGPAALLRNLGTGDALRLARFLLLPARRMGRELFGGEAGRLLLAGCAAHADVPVDAPLSGLYGWLLTMLGQDGGFPVPVGGAGELTAALRRRAEYAGATVLTGHRVERIAVSGGRASAVHTATGHTVRATRAVLADVGAVSLYRDLLPAVAVPPRLRDDLTRFEWDTATIKVDWALSGPVPWRAAGVRKAGTVHLGADGARLAREAADLASGLVPEHPFLLLGQMTTADPSRSPRGTETVWAYTHVPHGVDADEVSRTVERMQDVLESHAPGFGALVTARRVQSPTDLAESDVNLGLGAINGGTAQLHQQAIFRPVPGFGRSETVVSGLYLASAAAHPGGGVHGVCGLLAARAALADQGVAGSVRRRVLPAALRGLYSTGRSSMR